MNRKSSLIAGCRRRKLAHQVPLLRRFGSAVLFTKFRERAIWMATSRPLSRGAHDSKHSTAEPQSRFSSGTRRRELTGCRRLAQLAAAPKVILPTITFWITFGRRSPLAERLNCGKARGKRTSRGETEGRRPLCFSRAQIRDHHWRPALRWHRHSCRCGTQRRLDARRVPLAAGPPVPSARSSRRTEGRAGRTENGGKRTEGGRRHRAFRTCCRSMFPPPASQSRTSSVSRMRDVSTCASRSARCSRSHVDTSRIRDTLGVRD